MGIWWKNLSISVKLYSVVGIMAGLVILELFTLVFAMDTLSSVRAFVNGEARWSKAQKDAVYNLQRYTWTANSDYYNYYLEDIQIPLGGSAARKALKDGMNDFSAAEEGFLQGANHPKDIPGMIKLVRRFKNIPPMDHALLVWEAADTEIFRLIDLAEKLRIEVENKSKNNAAEIRTLIREVGQINRNLTRLEAEFSATLGDASRMLEMVLFLTLLSIVITVEGTGLFASYRFGRMLTGALQEMQVAAKLVSQGDFNQEIPVRSTDELGRLAETLNLMIKNLRHQRNERIHAEHASEAKSQFLANMSHEIRTPLNAILGFSELIQDPNISEEEREKFSQVIKRTGENLTTVINDILDLSKVEAEAIELNQTAFSLRNLISDLQLSLDLRCQEKGIQLKITRKEPVANYIISDSIRLRQILLNIIGNAIKFSEYGSVNVTYEVKHPYLVFTIKDTGVGIPPETLPILFKSFSQGDPSIRKKHGGSGLGLIISKKLAQLLGGDVELLETKVNHGSTFIVKIQYNPVAEENLSFQASEIEKQFDQLDDRPLLNKKILIVEDTRDNQVLIEVFLKKSGANVAFANNGEEALQKVPDNDFDLILMDIQMPVMDGYTATAELRKMGIQVPIIALTGYAMKDDRERCLKVGCNDYLSKPVDRRRLIHQITRYI